MLGRGFVWRKQWNGLRPKWHLLHLLHLHHPYRWRFPELLPGEENYFYLMFPPKLHILICFSKKKKKNSTKKSSKLMAPGFATFIKNVVCLFFTAEHYCSKTYCGIRDSHKFSTGASFYRELLCWGPRSTHSQPWLYICTELYLRHCNSYRFIPNEHVYFFTFWQILKKMKNDIGIEKILLVFNCL